MLDQEDFIQKFEDMQRRTVEATRYVASTLVAGENEKQIADRYYKALADNGLIEHWYPVLVYIGKSTSLPISRRYHLPSAEVTLNTNDIVMLDCTPLDHTVWSNWAETFSIGSDPFYAELIADSQKLVNQVYDFTRREAKTIGDIYYFAMDLIKSGEFISLDPMGDVGHSIFQVPDGQKVENTPMQDRTFLYPEHGNKQVEGIITIEPQLGKKHPITGDMYSTKIQKVYIAPTIKS